MTKDNLLLSTLENPPNPLCSFVRVVPTPCSMVMVRVRMMNSQGRVEERDHYGQYGLLPNQGGDKDKIRNGHKHFPFLASLPFINIILVMTKIILVLIILGLSCGEVGVSTIHESQNSPAISLPLSS